MMEQTGSIHKNERVECNTIKPGIFRLLDTFSKDGRLGAIHVSLYIAMVHEFYLAGCMDPLLTDVKRLMEMAKISSLNTYYKCVKELHSYGYIVYQRSWRKTEKSKIYLGGD